MSLDTNVQYRLYLSHSNSAFNCGSNGKILLFQLHKLGPRYFSKALQRPVPSGTTKINKEIRKYILFIIDWRGWESTDYKCFGSLGDVWVNKI